MAKKKYVTQESNPWDIVLDCKDKGDSSDVRVNWEYIQEFLRKHPFLYMDPQTKQVIRLVDGVTIPSLGIQVTGTINSPVDLHMITIANGITAKAYSNLPFLVPQVKPATSEDEDRDAAKNSTYLLMYYRNALGEEELYKQIVGWIKPCGNAFLKTYWDKDAGEEILDPLTQQPAMIKGNIVHLGDVAAEVKPPQCMLIPKGVSYDKKLPWIGEKSAMPVEDIMDTWGEKVEPEDNLEDLSSLRAIDMSSAGSSNIGKLEGHAMVYEIYFRPTKKRPRGRLIIACNKKVLYDGVYDSKLTSKYKDEWHPYTHFSYLTIEGDYWAKTIFDYLVDLQVQINKLLKRIMDAKKYTKGFWLSKLGDVDWDTINWDTEEVPQVLYNPQAAGSPPQFVPPIPSGQDLLGLYNVFIQRMNDIAAQYETTRGKPSSSVTSGVQAEAMQNGNTMQISPLLQALANGFRDSHWLKVLRLCAVHFEDEGRLISVTGENNEAIAPKFTPDQIRSENIIIANGPWFFMEPAQREAKLEQLFMSGGMGNPQDPAVRKRFLDMMGMGGGLEELFADYTADVLMAKVENDLFKSGDLLEKDQVLINQHPLMQQYQAQLAMWQQAKTVREGAFQEIQAGSLTPEQMAKIEPPPDPGLPPQPPVIYRMARSYEDHAVHLEILNRFRKTTWYEKACLANPELRKATDFHDQSHKSYMTPPMPPGIPGGINIPAPPAGLPPGQTGIKGA